MLKEKSAELAVLITIIKMVYISVPKLITKVRASYQSTALAVVDIPKYLITRSL